MNSTLTNLQPLAFLITRVVAGYMFLLHGTAKFFEFPMSMTNGNGSVPLASIYGVGGILEIVGGIFFILGLFTRQTAFILSGMMAYAFFIAHGAQGNVLLPLLNGGELAGVYSVLFLTYIFIGGGKYSLDAKLFNKA
ncbi:TPA: DoxX family protein [Mannheimia haemolytica]|uniref:DoxX n=1 Tax=Mannheimia haemolytica TaxID=75985 RepID=A0A248ZYI3_MANHA|nr:DoxX family protein [Mannheimia haemolytica]AWW70578.1 DoxX family protein [Pasteurellaceae bacterium 12565]AGI31640.1 DoxX family protein [Mannheimia haemolytica USDA-ARS-USMARC-183]AGI36252.1 DoxX family protein [Mannheimia haemolytica USDA-ARS-USMARC-185]AGK00721.1 putative DoxX-like membrane protein [Mannheimia haemolytica M42548]AGQ25577.1 membrane protein [Mannheimia haemolytica D153]